MGGSMAKSHEESIMPEHEDRVPETKASETPEPEEVEVVAHSSDEEEEEPWCVVNNSSSL